MRGRGRVGAAVVCFCVSVTAAGARADEPPAQERVPLELNFSVAERVTIATAGVVGIAALAGGPSLYTPDSPSMGPPAPGSLDRRISESLYPGDGDGRFMWRVPDRGGLYVLPYLPAIFYGTEALYYGSKKRPLFEGGDVNADHRFWAYVEALGWTALLTGVTKLAVGRTRPYDVLQHPQFAGPERERDLSFYSSHAATVFCAASFVALDLSDTLHAGSLRNAGAARRFLLGTLVPYVGALGLASVVGISRIVDQQHWASDVVVGAGVGTAAAHLAYIVHFDTAGRPRRRLGTDALGAPGALALGPMPGGVVLRGLLP